MAEKCAHCGYPEYTSTFAARRCLACGKITNNDDTPNTDRVLVDYAGNLADLQRGGATVARGEGTISEGVTG